MAKPELILTYGKTGGEIKLCLGDAILTLNFFFLKNLDFLQPFNPSSQPHYQLINDAIFFRKNLLVYLEMPTEIMRCTNNKKLISGTVTS